MAQPKPDFETQPHLPAGSDSGATPVPASASRASQTRKPMGIRRLLTIAGPGLITGAADDDPSGIATYVQTGAQFGYGQLWTALFALPLMTAVQEASARIGAVTGKGLAAVMRERYGVRLVYSIILLLLVANTINIGADIGAMAAAAQLIIPLPFVILTLVFTISMVAREILMPYAKYVRVLKWLTIALLAYPITVFVVHEPWGTLLRATFVPHLVFTPAFLFILTGVLGTTITPYMFFWEASEEVEEERRQGLLGANGRPTIGWEFIRNIRIDNASGMIASQVVSWCIIVVGATVLHNGGITNVNSAADAAKALVPLVHTFPHAGTLAEILFAVGIVALGLLAVPGAGRLVRLCRGRGFRLDGRPEPAIRSGTGLLRDHRPRHAGRSLHQFRGGQSHQDARDRSCHQRRHSCAHHRGAGPHGREQTDHGAVPQWLALKYADLAGLPRHGWCGGRPASQHSVSNRDPWSRVRSIDLLLNPGRRIAMFVVAHLAWRAASAPVLESELSSWQPASHSHNPLP